MSLVWVTNLCISLKFFKGIHIYTRPHHISLITHQFLWWLQDLNPTQGVEMATDRSHLPQGNGSIAEESLLIESRREKPADLPSEKFNPNEQTWRLFKVQSVGLLLTTTLTAFITTTLKIFETRGNISITGVRVFSFITTALFLFLGVNLLVSFLFHLQYAMVYCWLRKY